MIRLSFLVACDDLVELLLTLFKDELVRYVDLGVEEFDVSDESLALECFGSRNSS